MNTSKQEELEQKLLKDASFQHILKFAPQSQRELMTFELARFFSELISAARKEAVDEYIEPCLAYCLEQNGMPYCKNCGLEATKEGTDNE